MENILIKTAFLFFLLVVAVNYSLPAYAQTKDQNVDRIIARIKPRNYEYSAGEKVGISLLKKCAMLDGIIREINGSRITFSIKEKLLGEKSTEKTIELNYKKPYLKSISATPSSWAYVEVKKGQELIVFYCGQDDKNKSGEYAYITSDKRLFPSIKKSVVHYISYKRKPEILLEVPDLTKTSNDMTFLGYIIEFLTRGGASENNDNAILVLSQLMAADKIPKEKTNLAQSTLLASLSGSRFFSLTSGAQDKLLKTLVDLASSNKKLASEGIIILAQVANRETVDLKPYLNKQNRLQIIKNLKILPKERIHTDAREKFGKLLGIT